MVDRRVPPATRYAATPGGYVAYQAFGDGPIGILFITNWMTNLDVMWDEPALAAYLGRLAGFGRVVCFDKRGSGVSDPVPLTSPPALEEWMDDAVAALDAAGVGPVAVIGDTEGGPMAMLLAATYPQRVTALALVNTFARWRRAADYPIGMPDETTAKLIERWAENWGFTAEILALTAPSLADDERARRWFTRYQRLAMPPGAAVATYSWVLALDVRAILPSISVPTLVLHRREARHHRIAFGRYLAEHISGAKLMELDGADTLPFHAGDVEPLLSAIELFFTGTGHRPIVTRRLATVLMSDIVGSTALASKLGDARWRELLADHDAIVRDVIARFQGEELGHTGDGIIASFDGPTRAVTCAELMVDALARIGLTVRIGLHAGELENGPEGPMGLALHIAARVMALAGEGGILVSRTVKDLAFGSDVAFEERGEHELRGVPGTWSLFAVSDAHRRTRADNAGAKS